MSLEIKETTVINLMTVFSKIKIVQLNELKSWIVDIKKDWKVIYPRNKN